MLKLDFCQTKLIACCLLTLVQPGGADPRRSRWSVCSSYIPTSTYPQAGSVPSRSPVPAESHAEDA